MICPAARFGIVSIVLAATAAGAFALASQDKPKQDKPKPAPAAAPSKDDFAMPPPEKEHEWLNQLVGEWSVEGECTMGPGGETMKSTGTESVRSLGGYWVVADGKGTMMGEQFQTNMQIGFDPKRKKYVATWIGSMMSHLWTYTGSIDAAGKTLTLETEGPNMMDPTKTCKYREAIEIKSKTERVFTSSMQGDDGKWVQMMTANYRKK